MSASPSQLIERLVQQRVAVHLKDGRQIAGRLSGCDEHLNLVLEEAHETSTEARRRLGRVVLRGSNIISLTADGGAPARGIP